MRKTYLLAVLCLVFFNAHAATPQQEFWQWFEENQNELYDFERPDEAIFKKFSKRLESLDSEIGFEFSGVKDNGKRELTISAGGVASTIPAVEKLYTAAPVLERWEFLKFKQRKTNLDGFKLGYEGRMVEYKDVKYRLFEDGEKLGVVLFFKDYKKQDYEFFLGTSFLLLDLSLGEFDVMTKMGFLEVMGDDSKYFESSKPLKNIATDFDEFFSSKEYNKVEK